LFKGFYARQRFLLTNGAAFFSRQALYLSLNTAEDFNRLEARLGDGATLLMVCSNSLRRACAQQ
jgi:hypothetical protein